MKRLLVAVMLAVSMVAAPIAALAQQVTDPNVTPVPDGDAAMNAAIETARRTLPRFIEMSREKVPSRYSLKMPLETDGNVEHIWMVVTGFDGTTFTGKLSNTPALTDRLSAGSDVSVAANRISDWMVVREDGIYGAYTTRLLLDRLPPEQAEALRQRLKPLPGE